MEHLLALPADFPHLRASSESFDRWADGLAEVTPAAVREGVEHLGRRERRRLVRGYSDVVRDAERAVPIMLVAAVAAALEERERPDPLGLQLLETDALLRVDPAEALTSALAAGDVWSFAETLEADAALAAISEELDDDAYEGAWHAVVAHEAERLATSDHRRRLARLVRRLVAFEPCPCHPRAWAAIAAGAEAFERERGLPERVLELLLGDSLARVWQRRVLRAA